jgi:colanic acid/amylovoran biosynthesis glycosyltransferase
MRLAVFTSHFPGRVNTFFARDMRALLEAGIELDIFPLYPLDPELWRYVPEILDERTLARDRIHHIDLAQTISLKGLSRGRRVRQFVRDTAAIRAAAWSFGFSQAAKNEYLFLKSWAWAMRHADEFDHVLAYWGNYSATAAYIFHRLMNRRVPFTMFLHAGTDLYRDPIFLREKMLHADNIMVVCDFNRQYIKATFPDVYPAIADKIHLYHLGLDLSEFVFRAGGRKANTVLAVGSLETIKGFDYLIRAIALLAERGQRVHLDIIGSGPELGALSQLARQLGIAPLVTFHGLLPFDQVREAMSQATILVHPSIGLGDAVPTVIKEAMALGTPIVASAVAGIPELLDGGRCGVLVPPCNPESLSGAIQTLLADDSSRRLYASLGRQFAERQFDLWRNGSVLAARLMSATTRRDATASLRLETIQ